MSRIKPADPILNLNINLSLSYSNIYLIYLSNPSSFEHFYRLRLLLPSTSSSTHESLSFIFSFHWHTETAMINYNFYIIKPWINFNDIAWINKTTGLVTQSIHKNKRIWTSVYYFVIQMRIHSLLCSKSWFSQHFYSHSDWTYLIKE